MLERTLSRFRVKVSTRWAFHVERRCPATTTEQKVLAIARIRVESSLFVASNGTFVSIAWSATSTRWCADANFAVEWRSGGGFLGGDCDASVGFGGGAEDVVLAVCAVVTFWASTEVFTWASDVLEGVSTEFEDTSAAVNNPEHASFLVDSKCLVLFARRVAFLLFDHKSADLVRFHTGRHLTESVIIAP
jgi:hypothetical protein